MFSVLAWTAAVLLALSPAAADSGSAGKLTGVVVNPSGVPQMGATVSILSESVLAARGLQLLTNERGIFTAERLLPGEYSIRVTLAGFLPAVERHVRIEPNLTTLLKIELDSVFTSLDRLRRQPRQPSEPDDWAWVLRTSAATRPVLRWVDGEIVYESEAVASERRAGSPPHGRFELTAGARRPGSVSNLADAPAAAFAYDQSLGRFGHLLMAGQASYERSSAGGGFAAVWLPTGDAATGSQTTFVLRQAMLGPDGPGFHGARLGHSNQMQLGERWSLHYGSELVRVHLGRSVTALRPQGELVFRGSPRWRASLWLGAQPSPHAGASANTLTATLEQLDAFPVVMLVEGRPVLEGGWHQELAAEHLVGRNASVFAAVFRDRSRHTAVFGRGARPAQDFLPDFYSRSFAFDGGELNTWGTRLGLRQRFSEDLEAMILYAWAGALTVDEASAAADPRDLLHVRPRHSLAGRVTTRVPRLGTRLTASYKWTAGAALSRQDGFGEAAFQIDPNLNVTLRQPLPNFFSSGRFEAVVDVRNLLAQGYVPVSTGDGNVVLVSQFRTIRGGLAFQF
jgi:hypothetical protein